MNSLATFMNGQAGVAVALLLLALLAVREVARVSAGPRWQALARALTIAATPLVIIFLATVAVLFLAAVLSRASLPTCLPDSPPSPPSGVRSRRLYLWSPPWLRVRCAGARTPPTPH